jgi:plasmid stability protein
MSEYEAGAVVVVNVGRELKERLRARARENDRSLSAEVRRSIRLGLAQQRDHDDEKEERS